jgi:MoxR-like ATPase
VPRIIGEGQEAKSRFCPPESIARDEPCVLFLDELNGSSHEVQQAFYSLILDRRLGSYTLHPVPWDVELARWFDDHFAPAERRRSYARASRRRQGAALPFTPRGPVFRFS